MEIVVTGRHVQVSDRFRQHLDDKLAKVPQLAPRVQRLDVVVTHEPNRRQSKSCDRVEITCHVKGPVIRAEACADDKYGALDVAMDKLLERLRRANDRRQVPHRGRHVPESVGQATARLVGRGRGRRRRAGRCATSDEEPDPGRGRLPDRGPREDARDGADGAGPGAVRDGAGGPRLLPLPRRARATARAWSTAAAAGPTA